ncbi:anthranilate/para-aminobenzoate synthase component i [Gluconobacter frateurii NBRC 103465]|nr:anthranilate/para-aminobenzoate synthase component i [Gluconobacter frateurii NBRC 103465]
MGGIVGIISYDEGMRKENILSQHNSNTPEMVFAVYQDVYAFDRLEKRCWWISRLGREAPHLTPRAFFEMIKIPLKAEQSRKEWTKNAEKIISYIGNGDIFQANLTMRWRAEKPENFDELSAYYSLRDTSPAPFWGLFQIPTLFFIECFSGTISFALINRENRNTSNQRNNASRSKS